MSRQRHWHDRKARCQRRTIFAPASRGSGFGVDVKLAQIRDILTLHSTGFSKVEAQLADLGRKIDARFDEILQGLPPQH
jgi:hypothetical protein